MDRLARVLRPAEGISMLHRVALVLLSRGTQQPCQCLTLRSNHRSRLPPPTAPFRQHGVVCTHACWGTKVSRAVAQPAAGGHTHNLRHPLPSRHPGAAAKPLLPPCLFHSTAAGGRGAAVPAVEACGQQRTSAACLSQF
jgi:hypothetical protein